MYSVTAQVADLWRQLLFAMGREAGMEIEVVEHPAPAPLAQLWQRADKAAVFMCGLPYSQAAFAAQIIAAPVPTPADFGGQPRYWSELVVRADSQFSTIEDTFGRRMAFTVADSQSGYAAPLNFLRTRPGPHPRYAEIIAPRVTPLGALQAVIDGAAEVAPVDSYAFALLQRYAPQFTSRVRSVARTDPTPIPPLVSSPAPLVSSPRALPALQGAFLQAHRRPELQTLLAALLIERFVLPDPGTYDKLSAAFEDSLAFWRQHALASIVHPAFL